MLSRWCDVESMLGKWGDVESMGIGILVQEQGLPPQLHCYRTLLQLHCNSHAHLLLFSNISGNWTQDTTRVQRSDHDMGNNLEEGSAFVT